MSSSTTDDRPAIAFVPERDADVILKSSDGINFSVRRLSLQASCEVFDGMFASASSFKSDEDGATGLPVIKLDEKGADLDLLLRFVIREQDRRTTDGKPMPQKDIMRLITLADKYGAKAVIDSQDPELRRTAMTYPAELFGFAMSRGLIETARAALGSFQAGYNRSSLSTQPWLLSLVPFEDLARLPVEVILDLHRAQELVLLAESRWSTEAAKVKLT